MAKFEDTYALRARVGTDAGLRRGIQTSEGIGALGGAVASFVTALVSLVIMVSQAAKGQPIDVSALGGTAAGVLTGGLLLFGYASGRTRLKLAELQTVQQIAGQMTSDPASEPLDSPAIATARAAVLRAHADYEAGRITREEYRAAINGYEAVERTDDERSVVTRGCALARAVRGIAVATLLGAVAVHLAGCAYRPPAQVLSGEWRLEPAAADAHAAAADATAAQLLGWSLGLLGSGAAAVPTAAALDGLDADQRALAITSGAVGLAAGAVLLWRWAVLGEVAQQWRLVRDVVASRASPWEALVLPADGPGCVASGCP